MDRRIAMPNTDYGDPIARWLVTEAFLLTETKDLVAGIAQRLVEAGIPLFRLAYFRRSPRPEFLGTAYFWRRGQEVVAYNAPYSILKDVDYLDNPLPIVYAQGKTVRVRLKEVEPRFPLLKELKAEGATDYVIMPVFFGNGHIDALSVVADGSDGFTAAQLDRMYALQMLLARIVEIHALRITAINLLDAYVGHEAGARILSGVVQRGDGETIRAVIWFADLRDFTRLSDTLPRETVIGLLNDYFDAVGEPVTAKGGEILKFIGDAMLAILPVREGGDGPACAAALDVALAAKAAVAETNRKRAAAGQPEIRFGLGVHIGEVLFGNIGTSRRLDFTVIGPAVNHVTRLESLAKPLGQPIVISAEVAAYLPGLLRSLGRHALRGVEGASEVFAPVA
ncbi:MAG: adenylate/guanylate cyclase domain-containing protein [Alphaproteobacteria bacterium]|nr:adenylate/guanylate cyclase domain-containing protein [Alphaproteobacteria bacterium]